MVIAIIDNVCNAENPGIGGHSDIVWAMAKELTDLHINVIIVAPYSSFNYPFKSKFLKIALYKSSQFPDQNGITRILHVTRAVRVLKKLEFDVVHTTDAFSAGITSSLVRNRPVVFTTSGNICQRQSSLQRLDSVSAFFYYLVSKQAARKVTKLVATSVNMQYWWIKTGLDPSKAVVIPLGTQFVHPSTSSFDGPFRILFVGRLTKENNPDYLIELYKKISNNLHGKRFSLTIVGDGPMKLSLEESLKRDNVYFKGTLTYDALLNEYHKHHLLVVLREAGAPPRVAIEALAQGLPIIAFTGNGLEDYVESNGFIVDPSIDLMAQRACHLANSQPHYDELVSKIPQSRKLLNWNLVVQKLITEVYRPIMGMQEQSTT